MQYNRRGDDGYTPADTTLPFVDVGTDVPLHLAPTVTTIFSDKSGTAETLITGALSVRQSDF